MPRCHTIKKSAEILYLFVGTVCATHFHKCHTKKYSEGLVWDLEMSKNGLNTDVRDCGTSGTRHTPYIYTEYIYKIIYTYFLYSVLKICPSVPQRLEMLINTGLFPWDSLSRTVPHCPASPARKNISTELYFNRYKFFLFGGVDGKNYFTVSIN